MRAPVALTALCLALLAGPVSASRDKAEDFAKRGDFYVDQYRYRCAAQCYKTALRYDPDNRELWEKHRKAFNRFRVVEGYIEKAKSLAAKGYYEEACNVVRLALKTNPRDDILWRMYESFLASNPHVVSINSEREAWEIYETGKKAYEDKRFEAAKRYFDAVLDYSKDEKLRFYVKKFLEKTETRIKEFYPNVSMRVADR